jgi:hypothetical protein
MDVFLIKNGVVENCICADSTERAQQFYPDYICIERIGDLNQYGPSDLYDGNDFSKAPVVVLPPAPVSRLEFLRSFTAQQRISIRAANDPIIVDALQLLDLAEEINLQDSDVIFFVNYCADQGYITTADANRILGVTV